ncbi:MAG: thioredoxin family protein [Gammaproteobacteria bacterium]|nr:thioredoxin family protein [Gammaproteobacteria bacterium]
MLNFYTTAGCHLCEHAAVLLTQLKAVRNFEVVEVDIVTEERLIARYGTRIPVVCRSDTLQELSWPFTLEQLESFI